MLIDMLHRGPSAKTIALLYAAVVVVAALVVIAVVPTGRPESNAGDHRRLPEYKEMLRQYKMAIKQRERAVKDELVCLYDEATRTENHKLKLFSMDQQAALELRKPRWEPKTEWEKWFPGGEFPEPLARILQQYEKRYYDASAKLQDDYEKLATDLVRRGRTKDAAALRADAKDRWALVDLKPQPPGEESLVVEPPSAEIPSPPVPPPQEPQPPMVPEKVESKDSPLDEPIVAWPEMVVEVEGPPPPPPPRRRFIDLNSFECREDNRRMRLVDAFGGSDATEEAVTRALHWLVQHQQADGLWSLQGPYANGGLEENRLAATAMALLAFQGAGNPLREGRHQGVVERAWKSLVKTQFLDGGFDLQPPTKKHLLYAHALATIAACELYGMTKDDAYKKVAQRALDYAVRAQGPDGGWRYEPGQQGDMSVTAWYMMALKAGQMAGLEVRPKTLEEIDRFLDLVAVKDGLQYGYRKERPNSLATPVTVATSAAGLLCRQYRGWRRDNLHLVAGTKQLLDEAPFDWDRNEQNAYACYAFTQVAHHMGGETWRLWNDRMKKVLPRTQDRNRKEQGSWDPTNDRWGKEGGRLYVTCFCTYMLQVYYRYPPIYEGRLDECELP